MHRVYTKILAVSLVVLAVSPAFAQRQPGGRFGGGGQRQMGAAQLLTMDKVQEELKITDDQKAKLTKITDTFKDDIAAARTAMDRTKLADLRKSLNEAVEKAESDILNTDQLKRFKQIQLQAAGLTAFTKDDVQTALKLTDDQKKTIKDTTDGLQKDITDLMANAGQGAARGEAMTKIQGMRKDASDKVLAVLTDDQKKTWTNLTGDKFEFPAPQRRNRTRPTTNQ